MKFLSLIFLLVGSQAASFGQTQQSFSDQFLTKTFKVLNDADVELRNHMYDFVYERLVSELKDSSSFYDPYDSLSKQITIRASPDSSFKMYSWYQSSGGCCHMATTLVQYKTSSGKIKLIDLENNDSGQDDLTMYEMHPVLWKNKQCYLLLGWGSCCGGTHYQIAKLFEVKNDSLVKCGPVFDEANELVASANRNQKINLKYDTASKILSYNFYPLMDELPHHTDEMSRFRWKLTKSGFKKKG